MANLFNRFYSFGIFHFLIEQCPKYRGPQLNLFCPTGYSHSDTVNIVSSGSVDY